MLEEIITRLQTRQIEVSVDPQLQRNPNYQRNNSNNPERVHFTLFDLVWSIGLSTSVRVSGKIKFSDAAEYLERFVSNPNRELRVLIIPNDVDDKRRIASDIGEGLSILIAERFFNLQRSTISRIKRSGRSKPDYRGYNNRITVVWEAKGTTNDITQRMIDYARWQKTNEQADINFISLASLKEDSITKVLIEDPPALPLEGDDLNRQLQKVQHYTKIFNFIGQAELSRYFALLGKRIKKDKKFPEYPEKERLFYKIKHDYVKIEINGKTFIGKIERIGEKIYLYVGFDERLMSVDTFIQFGDYEEPNPGENEIKEMNGNVFRISRDGICFGILKDLTFIINQIDFDRISYYRDNLGIVDYDNMLSFQLENQISYLFEKEGFKVEKSTQIDSKGYGLVVRTKENYYFVEIKKHIGIKTFDVIKRKTEKGDTASILFTTSRIPKEDIDFAKNQNIIIIDRLRLKHIIKDRKQIRDYLIP